MDKIDAEKPNIVVIVADDLTIKTVGALGNKLINTPNIDRLAAEGTLFTNAYCNSPICSASRQSMLTGKYPHATGVNLLFTPFNDNSNYTLAEHLKASKYTTCLIGKSHFNEWIYAPFWDSVPTYGFDTIITSNEWKQWLKSKNPLPLPENLRTRADIPKEKTVAWLKNAEVLPQPYRDSDAEGTFFARQSINFIAKNQNSPFMIWLAFHEPHAPFAFPVEYTGRYLPEKMELPEGSMEDDPWVPEIFKNLTEMEKKGIMAAYYSSVSYMDKNVGLVFNALDSLNLNENTLVIFVSDNGYLLNDHKRFEKHTMWNEAVKIPLIIKGNKIPVGKNGQLTELVDLFPTICEFAGLKIPESVQGKSLLPLYLPFNTTNHPYVFSEYLEDNLAMVADTSYKYIITTGKRDLGIGYTTGNGPSGLFQSLYNIQTDPKETKNLANNSEYGTICSQMQQIMLTKFLETHPNANDVPKGLNITGKLVWFLEPNDVGDEPGEHELDRIFLNN